MAATSSIIRTISEFNPTVETISAYLEHLEMFFAVNVIDEGKKVSMLGPLLGAKNYLLL